VRIKPLILLILIVVLPLGGLTWLGLRVARDDEAALQRRFEEVFAFSFATSTESSVGTLNRYRLSCVEQLGRSVLILTTFGQ
jgi:hypothetical protein